jgi:hypothetical protein
MFCHLNPRSVHQSKPRQEKLVDQMGALPFTGSFWLLAYEAAINNWIPDSQLPRDQMTPFMKEMAEQGVSFFDRNVNPRFIRSGDTRDVEYEAYAIEDMAGRYDDDDDDVPTRSSLGVLVGLEADGRPWLAHDTRYPVT